MSTPPGADYDGAWKVALQTHLQQGLALLSPGLHARLDWAQPPEFLDRELQQLATDGETGRRTVDLLVRLRSLDGATAWVIIHVEVQSRAGPDFTQRMYRYYARLSDRYATADITSLAVILRGSPAKAPRGRTVTDSAATVAQGGPAARVMEYAQQGAECALNFRFPAVYLEDWRAHVDRLTHCARANPFAVILLAQLQATARASATERRLRKTALLRMMYEYRHARDDVLAVFTLLDWLLTLPRDEEQAYLTAVKEIEMDWSTVRVTSIERFAHERGLAEGRQYGLAEGRQHGLVLLRGVLMDQMQSRFGSLPDWAVARVQAADESRLTLWSRRVLDAATLDDVVADAAPPN